MVMMMMLTKNDCGYFDVLCNLDIINVGELTMVIFIKWQFQNYYHVGDLFFLRKYLLRETWHTLAHCCSLLCIALLNILAFLLNIIKSKSWPPSNQNPGGNIIKSKSWPPSHPLSPGGQKIRPPHHPQSQAYSLWLSLWFAQVSSEIRLVD